MGIWRQPSLSRYSLQNLTIIALILFVVRHKLRNLCCDYSSSTEKIPDGLRYLYTMAPPSGPAMSNKSILNLRTNSPLNADQAWGKLRSSQQSRHLSINWVIQIPEKLSAFLRRLPAGNLRVICTSRTLFKSEAKDVKVLGFIWTLQTVNGETQTLYTRRACGKMNICRCPPVTMLSSETWELYLLNKIKMG